MSRTRSSKSQKESADSASKPFVTEESFDAFRISITDAFASNKQDVTDTISGLNEELRSDIDDVKKLVSDFIAGLGHAKSAEAAAPNFRGSGTHPFVDPSTGSTPTTADTSSQNGATFGSGNGAAFSPFHPDAQHSHAPNHAARPDGYVPSPKPSSTCT